ncbi:MAG TPA: starch synthase, partial [Fibrobacter sp.]|nr:starch synthase [Fibrobacter sp.]
IALRIALAGADLLFASNLQEPSASLVLKALAGGTIPLSGKNVGVANLLHDFEGDPTLANALLVDDAAAPHQMLRRLREAEVLFTENKEVWKKIVENAYLFRYEWDRTISQYLLTLGEH